MQYWPMPHRGAGTRGDKGSGGRSKALARGEGASGRCAPKIVGRPMPAVHFECLLESEDTKGACNEAAQRISPELRASPAIVHE